MASCPKRAKLIERLARRIAGCTADSVILEWARAVAQAEFDIARIRQLKVALIERALAFGEFDTPDGRREGGQFKRFLNGIPRTGMAGKSAEAGAK